MGKTLFKCSHCLKTKKGFYRRFCMNKSCSVQPSESVDKQKIGVCGQCSYNCNGASVQAIPATNSDCGEISSSESTDEDYVCMEFVEDIATLKLRISKVELMKNLPKDVSIDEALIKNLFLLYKNVLELIKSLPHQSSTRCSIISLLSDGFSPSDAANLLQVGKSSIYRYKKKDKAPLYKTTTGYNRTRKDSHKKNLEVAVDDLIPFKSGRTYRENSNTRRSLYNQYLRKLSIQECQEKLSYSYFCSYLKTLRIRNVTTTTCPHCIELKELSVISEVLTEKEKRKLEKATLHTTLFPIQREMYLKKKQLCETTDDYCLLVMDFAKIDVYHHSFQILHLIFYFGNQRRLKSFIGHKKERNDVYFVIDVFLTFILPFVVQNNFINLIIFSDGGGKHFKCTQFLSFLWKVNSFYSFSLEYNFFVSYHGCNGCDGAAAQASQKVKRYIQETQCYPRTSSELKSILDELNNHDYELLQAVDRIDGKVAKNLIKVPTLKGIRSFHNYTFEIQAFSYLASQTSDPDFCNEQKLLQSVPSIFPTFEFPLLRLFTSEPQ